MGLSAAQAGAIGSYALFGMLFGAISIGTITDYFGRKWTLIACVTIFSLTMIVCAVATSPEMFGLFRFIGGIGLGGVIPTASALAIEYSPSHRRSLNYALMFSGYSFGTVLGAILAILLLQSFGWRVMFWIGAIPLLLVPIMIKFYRNLLISFYAEIGRKKQRQFVIAIDGYFLLSGAREKVRRNYWKSEERRLKGYFQRIILEQLYFLVNLCDGILFSIWT